MGLLLKPLWLGWKCLVDVWIKPATHSWLFVLCTGLTIREFDSRMLFCLRSYSRLRVRSAEENVWNFLVTRNSYAFLYYTHNIATGSARKTTLKTLENNDSYTGCKQEITRSLKQIERKESARRLHATEVYTGVSSHRRRAQVWTPPRLRKRRYAIRLTLILRSPRGSFAASWRPLSERDLAPSSWLVDLVPLCNVNDKNYEEQSTWYGSEIGWNNWYSYDSWSGSVRKSAKSRNA